MEQSLLKLLETSWKHEAIAGGAPCSQKKSSSLGPRRTSGRPHLEVSLGTEVQRGIIIEEYILVRLQPRLESIHRRGVFGSWRAGKVILTEFRFSLRYVKHGSAGVVQEDVVRFIECSLGLHDTKKTLHLKVKLAAHISRPLHGPAEATHEVLLLLSREEGCLMW